MFVYLTIQNMEKSKIDSQYDSSFNNYAPKDITTVQVKNWKYLISYDTIINICWGVFLVLGRAPYFEFLISQQLNNYIRLPSKKKKKNYIRQRSSKYFQQ